MHGEEDENDDVNSLIEQDPDLAYLVDDEDDETTLEEELDDDGKPKKKPAATRPAQEPEFDEDAAERELRKRRPDLFQQATPPAAPPVPAPAPGPAPDPNVALDAFAGQFADDLLKDPKMAVAKFLRANQQYTKQQVDSAIREVQATYEPARSATADLAIDRELDRIKAGPDMDDEVRTEIDNIIAEARKSNPQGISRMTPTQIRRALEETAETALGRVEMRRRNKARRRTPGASAPAYGGGSSGGTVSNLRRSDLVLTDDERGLIRNLKAAGLSKKDISQSLASYRTEKKALRA